MALELSTYKVGTTAILRVTGMVSGAEVLRFSHAIRTLIQQGDSRIAIDISKIEFMESHALGIVISHFLSMQRLGRELVLINSNESSSYMTHLLESTRLDEMIKILHPSSHS